jgi:alkane 1-monooxygenase
MSTAINKAWHQWKYLLAYMLPLATYNALYAQGIWTFYTLFLAFGILPLMEIFYSGTTENFTKPEEEKEKHKWLYDALIYLNVPLQYGLLLLFLNRISIPTLTALEVTGMITSFGICCGVIGINVAHELGHRRKQYEIIMAKMLLATTLYMHFYIEHNRGHHKNVSTPLDPATSRRGENMYFFWIRSIVGSYKGAWKLENHRLKKEGKSWFSIENEMLRFHIIQLGLCAAIFGIFGGFALLAFFGSSFIGYLLLESVNYIEHYGLQRKEIMPGVYEKCLPIHSWNSNHDLGRIMLYELTRHSDHHYLASRKYQVLRHFDQSPQLPTGYPGAIVLATIPPLWFMIMNKRVDEFNNQLNRNISSVAV